MKQKKIKILGNKKISQDFFLLDLEWKDMENPAPGQFLSLRVTDQYSPLLRRPFAFSGFDRNTQTASIIFQERGTATRILGKKCAGEYIDIIGPLGNSFPGSEKKYVLAAGGIGLGPMLYLAEHLKTKKTEFYLFIGAKTESFFPDKNVFSGLRPVLCTEDGSRGFHGNVVEAVKNTLGEGEITLYSCGPLAMLKACHEYAADRKATCWVSMEQVMACSMGACMGCVIKTRTESGFSRVCTEGPIFNSQDIVWE